MLDKRVPFHTLIMKRPYSAPPAEEALPAGYRLRTYRPGDERAWAGIEEAVLEFDTAEQALTCYDHYWKHRRRLETCQWFVESPQRQPVATATAWFSEYGGKRTPCVVALACLPAYQGMRLGRAVAVRMLGSFYRYDVGQDVYLDTQTWSYKAIGLYLSLGFVPLRTETYNECPNEYREAVRVLRGYMRPEAYERLRTSAR